MGHELRRVLRAVCFGTSALKQRESEALLNAN